MKEMEEKENKIGAFHGKAPKNSIEWRYQKNKWLS